MLEEEEEEEEEGCLILRALYLGLIEHPCLGRREGGRERHGFEFRGDRFGWERCPSEERGRG